MSQVPSNPTPSPTHEELAALELQVVQLRTTLDQAVAHAQRRNNVSLTIAAVVVLLILAYLGFAYSKLSQVDAEMAASLAQVRLMEYIPQAGKQLEGKLIAEAPDHIRTLELNIRQAPKELANLLKEKADEQLKAQLPKIEDELYEAIKTGLKNANATLKETAQSTPEKRLDALTDQVALVYGQKVQEFSEKVYVRYSEHAGYAIDYLSILAENKDLTERQRLQRQALIYLLAIKEFYDKNPPKDSPEIKL
jgi:predicted negative regulator of RcsB-dependent stress response